MGNYINFAIAHEAKVSAKVQEESDTFEVRNLLNRTRLALNCPPADVPSRDHPDWSKLAVFVYTDRVGPIGEIFDVDAVNRMVNEGHIDAWAPKPLFGKGEVTAADKREYRGWAKLGVLLLTLPDDTAAINRALDRIIGSLFFHRERGWLPAHVYQEGDLHVEPKLRSSFEIVKDAIADAIGTVAGGAPAGAGEPKAARSAGCCTLQ